MREAAKNPPRYSPPSFLIFRPHAQQKREVGLWASLIPINAFLRQADLAGNNFPDPNIAFLAPYYRSRNNKHIVEKETGIV
jgi:hypothetical protein